MAFSLERLFSFLTPENNAYEDMLENCRALAEETSRNMPVELRMLTLRTITDHILEDAAENHRYVSGNSDAPCIDERFYQDEFEAVKKLLAPLDFSDYLSSQVALCAIETAAWVRKEASVSFGSPASMKDFLHRMAERQTGFFGMEGIIFTPPAIQLAPAPHKDLMGWTLPFDIEQEDPVYSPVFMNEDMAAAPDVSRTELFYTCFHETLHVLLSQLAYMAHNDLIDESHPVYDDAGLLAAMHKYHINGNILLPTDYSLNPEEDLVTRGHRLFHGQLTTASPSGLQMGIRR